MGTVCTQSDGAFDAVIAAVVARAAALGLTTPPDPADRASATHEGWIHLPERSLHPLV